MVFLRSLATRLGASLAVLFLVISACSKVDRDYDPNLSGAGFDESEAGEGGELEGGGRAGTSAGGHAGTAGAPTAPQFQLIVLRDGSGVGSVRSDPAGIDCGTKCRAAFDAKTRVVLAATAMPGSTFAGWSGAGCSGTGECTTIMLSARSVTATFTSEKPALSVTLAGTGTGSVVSAPAGIDCGGTCAETVAYGTSVELTATPTAGSVFSGWSGGGCLRTEPCTVMVTEATAVTATFSLTTSVLTVTKAGTGSGTVGSMPAGISCGTDCTEPFNYGTSVTLTAAPAAGSSFAGWAGGGCAGNASTCTLSVTAAVTVTATFAVAAVPLTVARAGTGTGSVTSAPVGISCGTTCTAPFNAGSSVVLTATPTADSTFSGWSGGGCTGTGTCTVMPTAATTVTATFACAAGTVTVGYTGTIVSYTVPACVTSLTIDAYGAQGGSSLGATSSGGYGARMKGTFVLTGGQVLKVLAGGKGADATDNGQQAGGAGGGGTFVTTSTNVPLVVAGGGGGAQAYTTVVAGLPGTTAMAGLSGTGATEAGGINGNGGTSSNWTGWNGGTGGGGLLGNGVNNSMGSSYGLPATPGLAFVNGGAGGTPNSCGVVVGCLPGRAGGFGGGGAGQFTGGGGGGYSGGGAGEYTGAAGLGGGGGGGSYLGTSTLQTLLSGNNPGFGKVIFSY